jgi:sigma-B regulation protein RsbU (phosphoserine phosphatase)
LTTPARTGGTANAAPGPPAGWPDSASALALVRGDSAEDLYEYAPCGYLSTTPDGHILKVNTTLLRWLGRDRAELVGRRRFADLLTPGGKLYHETHYAPLLRMQGEVRAIALDLVAADGSRLPVLVTSAVKTDAEGGPLLIRTAVFDARERRSYERELLRARQEAERERQRQERLARTLQRTLLPPSLPDVPGLRLAARYRTASRDEVGGDFYDLFPLGPHRWGFFLGDVCGKGAQAAALTSLARYTLRAAAVYHPDPPAVLANLNTVLHQEYQEPEPRFCTVVFGLLEPDADGFTVTVAGGGHPPALVLRADGTVEPLHTPGGQLVGVLPDARFTRAATRLAPGDGLLLYSDGLTEARDPTGAMLGEDRVAALLAPLAATDAETIAASLDDTLSALGEGLTDDAALLTMTVPPRAPGVAAHEDAAGGAAETADDDGTPQRGRTG